MAIAKLPFIKVRPPFTFILLSHQQYVNSKIKPGQTYDHASPPSLQQYVFHPPLTFIFLLNVILSKMDYVRHEELTLEK